MSGYRNEWPCCGDETYTEAWEPERCPFCELNEAKDRIFELETTLRDARENLNDWGGYVPEYFAEKHGLAGDLEAIDDVLGGGNASN